jgi:hypothetical protein
MSPDRRETINGHIVEQYVWNRKLVVYIDNQATLETFDAACARLRKEAKP